MAGACSSIYPCRQASLIESTVPERGSLYRPVLMLISPSVAPFSYDTVLPY